MPRSRSPENPDQGSLLVMGPEPTDIQTRIFDDSAGPSVMIDDRQSLLLSSISAAEEAIKRRGFIESAVSDPAQAQKLIATGVLEDDATLTRKTRRYGDNAREVVLGARINMSERFHDSRKYFAQAAGYYALKDSIEADPDLSEEQRDQELEALKQQTLEDYNDFYARYAGPRNSKDRQRLRQFLGDSDKSLSDVGLGDSISGREKIPGSVVNESDLGQQDLSVSDAVAENVADSEPKLNQYVEGEINEFAGKRFNGSSYVPGRWLTLGNKCIFVAAGDDGTFSRRLTEAIDKLRSGGGWHRKKYGPAPSQARP